MNPTPPRKTKLYRKRMWCVVFQGIALTCKNKPDKDSLIMITHPGRIARVEVRELPKAAGRGRK